MYKGDFGRTIPVSGHFDAAHAETLDLLNGAYLAGLNVMKEGATGEDIVKASINYVNEHKDNLKSDMAGGFPRVLRARNVICFELRFTAGDQALFVEDTILITHNGHEILNPPLPYSAKDIEAAIENKPNAGKH
jgi:Xaa-Pro aminopeptidase